MASVELDLINSISFVEQDENKIKIKLAMELRKEKEGDIYHIFIENSPDSGSIEEFMLRNILRYYSKIYSDSELSVWIKSDKNMNISKRVLDDMEYKEVPFKVFSMYTQYLK